MAERSGEGIYFISDLHFGLQDSAAEKMKREKLAELFRLVEQSGGALYMLGDIFDYWMEFRHVVPKNFMQVYALLYGLVHSGVKVVYVAGNHDFHLGSFFDRELGIRTLYGLNGFDYADRKFLFAHGDGLGDGDLGYKLFARFVRTRLNLGLLTAFHPDLALALMKRLSNLSRHYKPGDSSRESNRLLNFAESIVSEREFDYFICGHNHLQEIHLLANGRSRYVNLGSWIEGRYPYGVFLDDALSLKEL